MATTHANRIRIIGGTMRGQVLRFPDAADLRPTPDRVRETLFNWLGQDLTGKRCLDLYAGTGALSVEAASRGAALCVAVDSSRSLIDALRANAERIGVAALETRVADARAYLNREAANLRRGVPRPAVSRRPVGMAAAGLRGARRARRIRLCGSGRTGGAAARPPAVAQRQGGAGALSSFRQGGHCAVPMTRTTSAPFHLLDFRETAPPC